MDPLVLVGLPLLPVALVLWMRKRMRDLPFAATLRQMRGDTPRPAAEDE